MGFFDALWLEARHAQTLWLLGLTGLALVAARVAAAEASRLKSTAFWVGMHGVLVLVTAVLRATGSALDDTLRTPAWVFGAVGFVDAGTSVLFGSVLPRLRIKLPRIVQDVLVAILSVVVAVAVAGRAGVNLSGLIATSAVITAVLGFSLQETIANVAGGLALQLDTALEVGDWVKVGEVTGKIVEMRWRHVSVETRNWETVLIPNAVLMKAEVTVLGRRRGQPTQLRRWVYFSVDFRHQPTDVVQAAEAAVRGVAIPNVAKDPAPNCVLMDVNQSVAVYALRYWLTDLAVDDPTDSEVRTRLFFGLHRAGLAMAIPAQAVFVTHESDDRKSSKAEQELERRRRLLEENFLFAALSDEERRALARGLKYAPFARDEVMTRQGNEAHWLYLIEDGEAIVRVAEGGLEKEVATLPPGSVFGEMSLLTGAPRSATVVAKGDVECYRLEKGSFQKVLEARPELAQTLATLLAKRRAELDSARQGLDAESARRREEAEVKDLSARIRSFFKLRS